MDAQLCECCQRYLPPELVTYYNTKTGGDFCGECYDWGCQSPENNGCVVQAREFPARVLRRPRKQIAPTDEELAETAASLGVEVSALRRGTNDC